MRGEEAEWDVTGYFAMCCDGGEYRGVDVRVRCYEDGHSIVDVDGVAIPIRPEMSATDYFHAVFRHTFSDPEDRRRAVGD